MKKSGLFFFFLVIFFLEQFTPTLHAQTTNSISSIRVSMQKRLPSDLEKGSWYIDSEIQEWNPAETAIIVCDLWNQHWCKGASARVAEMAPFMNNVISIARNKGILIVHAPSECMAFYKDNPARKLGQKYKSKKAAGLISSEKLVSEKDAVWPVDQSDGGCDCTPKCIQGTPWTRQIDLTEISDKDAISDSGAEIGGLFYQKGIKNVIFLGVNTNMSVIGSSFGLRNMIRLGMNVALMRDLTDNMYNSKQSPQVNHFTGNSLINEYIETYICPTIVSTDFTDKKQFRFKDDTRPVVAFLTGSEYNSNLSLPGFAHELLLTGGVNCEFAIGNSTKGNIEGGQDWHNIENLQILEDADMAVIFVRRRGLEPKKMDLIKAYVKSGKPVLGIRTASHAFVPRFKAGLSNDFIAGVAKWSEFDAEILGGNYKGHPSEKLVTTISIVPGMESHPLLKGVSLDNYTSSDQTYFNQSLQSDKAQVLLFGSITGHPSQPVLWTNFTDNNNVIYTSMGAESDWHNENFRHLMRNSVSYLLNLNLKEVL